MNSVAATVAICTYNRCATLGETLAAVLAQAEHGPVFDVLVVDNASTDTTRAVVEQFQGGSVAVRYVSEPTPGLSRARNCALAHADAPIIAFLDDDALPAPGWLHALLCAFEEFEPRPAAVGGPVRLRWTNGQPDWLPDELLGIYSYIDYGPHLQQVRTLHGCNLAFLTSLARQYGFDTRFGVSGPDQIPGEDTDILIRMRRDGLPIVFQPGAPVWHVIGEYRENRAYVMRRSRGLGKQAALLAVSHSWPGRRGVLALLARDFWNRRHWWKRMATSLLSGNLRRDDRERTWTRHALVRFGAFEAAMLTFALRGRPALGIAPDGAPNEVIADAGRRRDA